VKSEKKVAIVTGGASGIGKATAQLFGSLSYDLVVADIDVAGGEAVVEEINAADLGRATFVSTDLSAAGDISKLVEISMEIHGRIDVLHNNAGLLFVRKSLEDVDTSEWDRLIAVMLTGTFLATKAVFPIMRQQGGGLIVNTSSRVAWTPLEWGIPYATVKAGLLGFSRSVAALGRPHNIRCNAICPGAVKTALQRESPKEILDDLDRQGWLDPAEVAQIIHYFIENPSATGEEILTEMRNGRPLYFRSRPTLFEEFSLG